MRLQCIGTHDAMARDVPMPWIIAMPVGFASADIRIEPSEIDQPVFVRPGNNAAPTAATAKLASQHQ